MTETTNVKAGQYLTFQLQSEFYAVPIETVREINRVGEITPVPKTPPFFKGVMNLRGKIIPVINLRIKFGMEAQAYTRDTCIIVIDTEIGQVGMIVDAVKEVVDLKATQIESSPQFNANPANNFIQGLGKLEDRVIIMLDMAAALSQDNLEKVISLANGEQPESAEAA